MASISKCVKNNVEILERLKRQIQIGYDEGLEAAEAITIQKAISLAQERIYSKPVKTTKKGKQLYVRTGLYKASFSTDKMGGRRGFIFRSPTVYTTHLEYKCGYNIVKDSTLGQRRQIAKVIENAIIRRAETI